MTVADKRIDGNEPKRTIFDLMAQLEASIEKARAARDRHRKGATELRKCPTCGHGLDCGCL